MSTEGTKLSNGKVTLKEVNVSAQLMWITDW